MRWVKHLTQAHKDEKITALRITHGLEAYGFYWLLVELVGETVGKTTNNCQLSHPLAYWAQQLGCHHNKVQKYFKVLSELGLIQVDYPDLTTPQGTPGKGEVTTTLTPGKTSVIRVSVPKVLKYRDEYSARDKKCPDTDGTVDTERDRDKTPPTPSQDSGRKKADEELTTLVQPFAERMKARHPKKRSCGIGEVVERLKKIVRKFPANGRDEILRQIDHNHETWCASREWQKDEGEYAKALQNWLAPNEKRYLSECPTKQDTLFEIPRRLMAGVTA